ncbi:hypothetical protein ABE073_04955 [Lederbergia citrisecunda]|uniref:hypothetical protein n=1 Tax=Lederbergia citrisecunda TaxID=2833583 RepID=UPI003D28E7A4
MKEQLLAVKVLKDYQNKLRDERDVLLTIQADKDEIEKVNNQISDISDSIDVLESIYKLHASVACMLLSDN